MKATLIVLGALGVVCWAAAIVSGVAGTQLFGDALRQGQTASQHEIEELFRSGYVLDLVTVVVMSGALLATIAVLALLSWWSVRRARAR